MGAAVLCDKRRATGEMRLDQLLPVGPRAAAEARRSLTPVCRELPSDRADDVRLMVSELVTNAFLHAGLARGDTVHLTAVMDSGRLRIEVEDEGNGFRRKAVTAAAADRASGWGLTIVARLSDRWGVVNEGSTKVWFEIDARRVA